MNKNKLFSFDVGLVVDFGGVFGSGESDDPGDIAEMLSNLADDGKSNTLALPVLATISAFLMAFFGSIATALANTTNGEDRGWLSRLALYVGPSINLGPIYLTTGACIGGFGCFAAGGGIRFGNFGIGILIPLHLFW